MAKPDWAVEGGPIPQHRRPVIAGLALSFRRCRRPLFPRDGLSAPARRLSLGGNSAAKRNIGSGARHDATRFGDRGRL